jgi:beta-galactosidase
MNLGKTSYGGDWNPEQWDRAVWDEDVRLFKEAGIDLLTINIFSWTLLQPDEETYNFALLDEIIALLHVNGMKVCLGTGTAAHPAWMATKYPDILRVDFQGRKRKFGDRHNSCPSSPAYIRFAPKLAATLAERYKDHPAIALWHISNEFGGACYCENCERRFREWLRQRYGTLEALNTAWNATFWNQLITDWNEIVVPNQLSVQWSDRGTVMQGLTLDHLRFNSENLLNAYCLEYDVIRAIIPEAIITTNMMGLYRQLDYREWAKRIDIIAWDSYPAIDHTPAFTALAHDLMRGLKDGQPFLLMEQTPNQTNWKPHNALKRPGVMRLQSWQAVAHGADAVMFFQMRQSIGAGEKFHGAVIGHSGRSDTRVFGEVAALGAELQRVGAATVGSRIQSEVAIWFDWESWWASENSLGPSASLDYINEIAKYHAAFHDAHIMVDMVGFESDLSSYRVLIAPVLYLLQPGVAERITTFVQSGGTLVTGFLSGIANQSDLVFPGGPPGPLREMLGLWVEEIDALPPEEHNSIVMQHTLEALQGPYTCNLLFAIPRLEGAIVIATYGTDFYAGSPVLTRHQYGQGFAWFVASSPDASFLRDFTQHLSISLGIKPVLPNLPSEIEATRRSKDGHHYLFLLNHSNTEQLVQLEASIQDLLTTQTHTGSVTMPARGVMVMVED